MIVRVELDLTEPDLLVRGIMESFFGSAIYKDDVGFFLMSAEGRVDLPVTDLLEEVLEVCGAVRALYTKRLEKTVEELREEVLDATLPPVEHKNVTKVDFTKIGPKGV